MKNKKQLHLLLIAALSIGGLFLAGCDDNKLDDAVDETGDAMERGVDATKDAVHDAADAVKDATN